MQLAANPCATPFGEILGIVDGVPAYSNCNANHVDGDYLWYTLPGVSEPLRSGMKWQCVEYARRYLQITKKMTFENVNQAEDIWSLHHAIDLDTGTGLPFVSLKNGEATEGPSVGSLLIYSRGVGAPHGHVAVIVRIDAEFVYLAEQNWENDCWLDEHYSRKLKIRQDSDGYQIEDTHGFPILGWKTVREL